MRVKQLRLVALPVAVCALTLAGASLAGAKTFSLVGVVQRVSPPPGNQPGTLALMSGTKRVGKITFTCGGGGGIGAAVICSGPMSLKGYHGLSTFAITWSCHLKKGGGESCSQGAGSISAADGHKVGTIKLKTATPASLNHKNAHFPVVIKIGKR